MENFPRHSELLGQILAHARVLGTLAGKQECCFHNKKPV
jgi:hypothetical protein